jgi:hypothetical protein
MAEVAYIGNSDVRTEMSAAIPSGTTGYLGEAQLPDALLTIAVKRATREVNLRLKPHFPAEIPFASSGDVPYTIKGITTDLAVFFTKRAMHPGPAPLSETVKSEYWGKAIEALDKIIDGGIAPSELDSKGATTDDRVYDNVENRTPVFDMDEPMDWGLNENTMDQIEDDRA